MFQLMKSKMCYICTTEYYLAKKKVLICSGKLINFESMFSEGNQ